MPKIQLLCACEPLAGLSIFVALASTGAIKPPDIVK
jgi:hypothetical protein